MIRGRVTRGTKRHETTPHAIYAYSLASRIDLYNIHTATPTPKAKSGSKRERERERETTQQAWAHERGHAHTHAACFCPLLTSHLVPTGCLLLSLIRRVRRRAPARSGVGGRTSSVVVVGRTVVVRIVIAPIGVAAKQGVQRRSVRTGQFEGSQRW